MKASWSFKVASTKDYSQAPCDVHPNGGEHKSDVVLLSYDGHIVLARSCMDCLPAFVAKYDEEKFRRNERNKSHNF